MFSYVKILAFKTNKHLRQHKNNLLMEHTRQTKQVLHNIEVRSLNHCCRGKAISITYSESVSVALVIQYAKRLRRILSPVACLVVPYFPTLSHERYDFRKNISDNKIFVLIFSTTFV